MDKHNAKTLLLSLGVKLGEPRVGWVTAYCPFGPTRHKSGKSNSDTFGIKVVPGGLSHFNCFACGAHGDLQDLLIDLRFEGLPVSAEAVALADQEVDESQLAVPDFDELYKSKTGEMVEFPEHWLNTFGRALDTPAAMDYLAGRHVSTQVAADLDLRYDSHRHRVCFPIRDWKGALRGFHGRDVTGQSYPYHAYTMDGKYNKLVWLGESWVDVDQPVVLVESVFDLASVYRVYRNVMCALTSGLSDEKVKRISRCLDIVTVCDHGTGGERFLERIEKNLPDSVIRSVQLTAEQKDPGTLTRLEIGALLADLVQLDKVL